MRRTINMIPLDRATLTPQEFIELPETTRNAIKHVVIEPPRLGVPGFGRLLVEFSYPVSWRAEFPKEGALAEAGGR